MSSTYEQVLKTYTTRSLFWVGVAILAIMTLVSYAIGRSHNAQFLANQAPQQLWAAALGIVQLMAMPVGLMSVLVGTQLKRQFADPRSRLWVGFASPHIVVAGAIGLGVAVLYPWVVAANIGASATGSIAFSMLLMASVLWATYAMSGVLTTLVFVGWLSLSIPQISGPILKTLVMDGNPGLVVAILVACGAWLVAQSYRLMSLTKENPLYARHLPMNSWDLFSRAAKKERRQWFV